MYPSMVITLIFFWFFVSTEQVSVDKGNFTLSPLFNGTSSPVSNVTFSNATGSNDTASNVTATNDTIALPLADSTSLVQVFNSSDNMTSIIQVINLTSLLINMSRPALAQLPAVTVGAGTSANLTSTLATPRSFHVKRRESDGIHKSLHKTRAANHPASMVSNKTASHFGKQSQRPTATRFPRRRREAKYRHRRNFTNPAPSGDFAALNITDTSGQQVYAAPVDGYNTTSGPTSNSTSPFWWSAHAGAIPTGTLTDTSKAKVRPFTLQSTNFDSSTDASIGPASDAANSTSLDTSTSSESAIPTSLASPRTNAPIKIVEAGSSGGGGCGPQSTSGSWSGKGTFYSPSGQGACQTPIGRSDYLVAMNAPQYGSINQVSAWCGKTVHITNNANGKSVTATVRDACPECACGSLDLSAIAFKQIADPTIGIIQISWTA